MDSRQQAATESRTTSKSGRWRGAARAGVAAAVLGGSAVAGIGLADSASAATTATRTRVVEAWSASLPPLASTGIPQLVCPADVPYLVNQDFSPGRVVPRGVEVVESALGIGVTIPKTYVNDPWVTARGSGGFAASATNWDFVGHKVAVKLHCTSDRDASYWVSPDNREWGDYGS